MSQLGPVVVVAERTAADLIKTLAQAGAFPVVETCWSAAPAAFASVQPAAVVVAEPGPAPDAAAAEALERQLNIGSGPFVPLIGRCDGTLAPAIADSLAIGVDASTDRLVARLRSALRVRSLHATVLRRAESFAAQTGCVAPFPDGDPLEDAVMLVAGRGGSYPDLARAVGACVELIGARSIETAAHYLDARQIDGVIIGDGFGAPLVQALLTMLAGDARLREIPVALLSKNVNAEPFYPVLANLEQLPNEPAKVLQWLLPLTRLRAFEARLTRMLKSLDANGMFDADTGLMTDDAFVHELLRAVEQAKRHGDGLCVARFAFAAYVEARISTDAARLIGGALRNTDFACRDSDGAVLVVLTDTELQAAHLIARRIAATLKETMLSADRDPRQSATAITLATLKPGDTAETLLSRAGSRAVATLPVPA
jgi:GGDEF domain-containing protein